MRALKSLDVKLSSLATLLQIILDVKRYSLDMERTARVPGDSAPESGSSVAGCAEVRDEVDELVAAWQAERPGLDVQPLQVLSRVSRLARHLDRARRSAFAGHGLEPWEFDVLAAL